MSINPSLSFSNDVVLNNKADASIDNSLGEKDIKISNISPCSRASTSSINSK